MLTHNFLKKVTVSCGAARLLRRADVAFAPGQLPPVWQAERLLERSWTSPGAFNYQFSYNSCSGLCGFTKGASQIVMARASAQTREPSRRAQAPSPEGNSTVIACYDFKKLIHLVLVALLKSVRAMQAPFPAVWKPHAAQYHASMPLPALSTLHLSRMHLLLAPAGDTGRGGAPLSVHNWAQWT